MHNRKEKKVRRQKHLIKVIFALSLFFLGMALFISTLSFYFKFQSERFRKGTFFGEVNCSGLTINEAFEKLNSAIAEMNISFHFQSDTFIIQGITFDMKLSSSEELEKILNQQNNGEEGQAYNINEISINQEKLWEYLISLDPLKEENMHPAQNAYLVLGNDNLFYIEEEVLGTELDVNEAYALALNTLETGGSTIDFRTITNSTPEVTSNDLLEEQGRLNNILSTVVHYDLPDGSIFTLDSRIIRDWVSLNQNGEYQIDIQNNVESFMQILQEKVSMSNSTVLFEATGVDVVTLTVPTSLRASIDIEAETLQLQSELGTAQEYNRTPIYATPVFSLEGQTNYVEIDVTRQNVWMYKEGVCIVDTPCVTGNASNHNTPSGIFTLTYKTTDTYLKGYNDDGSQYRSHVNYWMPFNGGIGLHDALWRSSFGGTIYQGNGSHGCVNLPLSAAEKIYNNIDNSMFIIVYES